MHQQAGCTPPSSSRLLLCVLCSRTLVVQTCWASWSGRIGRQTRTERPRARARCRASQMTTAQRAYLLDADERVVEQSAVQHCGGPIIVPRRRRTAGGVAAAAGGEEQVDSGGEEGGVGDRARARAASRAPLHTVWRAAAAAAAAGSCDLRAAVS